jgi:indolepyruvate ferredoxin oxidoreductase, beta subunit
MTTKQDIIVAGVGGQGILTLSGLIGSAAVSVGLYVKQSEVHGMAQRGGSVVSHLRLSKQPIASDLIELGAADLILAMEPMEGLRYLPYARPDAALVTNQNPVRNIRGYPDIEKVLARVRQWGRHAILDAEKLARQAGNARAVNSVMMGAASPFLLVKPDDLRAEIDKVFRSKGQGVVDQNLSAFDLGRGVAGGV